MKDMFVLIICNAVVICAIIYPLIYRVAKLEIALVELVVWNAKCVQSTLEKNE